MTSAFLAPAFQLDPSAQGRGDLGDQLAAIFGKFAILYADRTSQLCHLVRGERDLDRAALYFGIDGNALDCENLFAAALPRISP